VLLLTVIYSPTPCTYRAAVTSHPSVTNCHSREQHFVLILLWRSVTKTAPSTAH